MSGRYVAKPHCSWTSLTEVVYQYYVSIISLVTDNLLFFNQRKREFVSTKDCAGREGRSRDCCLRSGHATDRATEPSRFWRISFYYFCLTENTGYFSSEDANGSTFIGIVTHFSSHWNIPCRVACYLIQYHCDDKHLLTLLHEER